MTAPRLTGLWWLLRGGVALLAALITDRRVGPVLAILIMAAVSRACT